MDPYFKITEVSKTEYCDVKQISDAIENKEDLNELNKIVNDFNTTPNTKKTIDAELRTISYLTNYLRMMSVGCADKKQESSSSEIVPITDFKMFCFTK